MSRFSWIFGVVAAFAPLALSAQDAHFALPIDEIETMLRQGELRIAAMEPARGLEGERTYRATADIGGRTLQLQYAPAAKRGEEFNNRPRYELAAYEIQRLFLDPEEYVVPPTAVRCFPTEVVQTALDLTGLAKTPRARKTFADWPMTMVTLQYWLREVEAPEVLWDEERVATDDAYARALGHFNLLTYLIGHNDSNRGNFLRSRDPERPRWFAVDNGIAFSEEEGDRGNEWRELRLERYPADTIERLRGCTLEQLEAKLGVLAQFELEGDVFKLVDPGDNLNPGRGVRRDETTLQLGLTRFEIRSVHRRIVRLLRWIDDSRYSVFP